MLCTYVVYMHACAQRIVAIACNVCTCVCMRVSICMCVHLLICAPLVPPFQVGRPLLSRADYYASWLSGSSPAILVLLAFQPRRVGFSIVCARGRFQDVSAARRGHLCSCQIPHPPHHRLCSDSGLYAILLMFIGFRAVVQALSVKLGIDGGTHCARQGCVHGFAV